MSNQPHTPTWEKVREHYYLGRQQFDDPLYPAGGVTEIVAEFDRWYEAEIAAAEQRGAEKALQDFKRFVIRVLPKGLVNRASIIADLDESMKRLNETGRLLMGPLNADLIEQEGDE